MEAQLNLLKKETHDYTYRCAIEARQMMDDVQVEAHNLDSLERDAEEILKVLLLISWTIKFKVSIYLLMEICQALTPNKFIFVVDLQIEIAGDNQTN